MDAKAPPSELPGSLHGGDTAPSEAGIGDSSALQVRAGFDLLGQRRAGVLLPRQYPAPESISRLTSAHEFDPGQGGEGRSVDHLPLTAKPVRGPAELVEDDLNRIEAALEVPSNGVATLLSDMTVLRTPTVAPNPLPDPSQGSTPESAASIQSSAGTGGSKSDGEPAERTYSPIRGEIGINGVINPQSAQLFPSPDRDSEPSARSEPTVSAGARQPKPEPTLSPEPEQRPSVSTVSPSVPTESPRSTASAAPLAQSTPTPASRPEPSVFEPPTPLVSAHRQIQQIELRVPGVSTPVGLVVSEVAGEEHVSVRTPDRELAAQMRAGVNDLTTALNERGFDFRPEVSSGLRDEPRRESPTAAASGMETPVAQASQSGSAAADAGDGQGQWQQQQDGPGGDRQQQPDRRQQKHDNRNDPAKRGSSWESIWGVTEPIQGSSNGPEH